MAPETSSPRSQPRIAVTCPGCHRALRRPAHDAGRTVRCPSCGASVAVPRPPRLTAPGVLVIEAEDLPEVPVFVPVRHGPTTQRAREAMRPAGARGAGGSGASTSRRTPAKGAAPRRRLPPRQARLQVRHVGKKCPYCQSRIEAGDSMTICPDCGIPHHAECWDENGGCTVWGCASAPRAAIRPAGLPRAYEYPPREMTWQDLNRIYTTMEERRRARQGCGSAIATVAIVAGLILIFAGAAGPLAGVGVLVGQIILFAALWTLYHRRWR